MLDERPRRTIPRDKEAADSGARHLKLLIQAISESVEDARRLAATVVFRTPLEARTVPVHELLSWIPASTPELVSDYMLAATIETGDTIGELRPVQRAAVIAALRLRRGSDGRD